MKRTNPIRVVANISIAVAVAVVSTVSAMAQEFKKKDLVIERPHAMATAPGQPHGAVFVKMITNNGTATEQLIGGRTTVSKSVEVHRMEMANNVMKMREIPAIDLPAKSKTNLGRGNKEGYHLMLMNLNAPLKEGDKIPMTFVFKNTGEVDVTVVVEKPSMAGHGGHKH